MTQLAGKETILNNLKISTYQQLDLIRLLIQIRSSPGGKCKTKFTSDHTKNFKLYINLAPCSS